MTREQKIRKARELRSKGWTNREIAVAVEANESTVRHWYLGSDCSKCGAPVDGSSAKKDRVCARCLASRNAERNELVFRLNEEGMPHWLIAEEAGCSSTEVATVLDYWRRRKGHDVPMHKLGGNAEERAERRAQIIAWRRDGLTNGEIAERLGTSRESVQQMFVTCRALGLDVPESPHPWQPIASPEDLAKLWDEGLTLEQIADFCGYSGPGAVSNRIARLRTSGFSSHFPPRRPGRRLVAA